MTSLALSAILPGSENTRVESIDYNGAGRDIISPTINFNFPERPPVQTASLLNHILHRLGLGGSSTQSSDSQPPRDGEDLRIGDTQQPPPSMGPQMNQGVVDHGLSATSIEAQPSTQRNTMAQTYVESMLPSGHGLPCWRPRPQQPLFGPTGVIPGDVGTYSYEGGFKRIFNLWEDEEDLLRTRNCLGLGGDSSYQRPERAIAVTHSELSQGDTVASGATCRVFKAFDPGLEPHLTAFDFYCHSQVGAALALTSPADLEELVEDTELREYICEHAELIYAHASGRRLIAAHDNLYIITGCVKSETWPLAAFQESLPHPDNLLRLEGDRNGPGGQHPHQQPTYTWTERGTAATRTGRSDNAGVKDQALFLRGFKLACSDELRSRLVIHRRALIGSKAGNTTGSNGPGPERGGKSGGQGKSASLNIHDAGAIGGGLEMNLCKETDRGGDREIVREFPHEYAQLHSSHPSDLIVERLLRQGNSKFALSHDDDWRYLLTDCEDIVIDGDVNEPFYPRAIVLHGVVYLEKGQTDNDAGGEDFVVLETSDTLVGERDSEDERDYDSDIPSEGADTTRGTGIYTSVGDDDSDMPSGGEVRGRSTKVRRPTLDSTRGTPTAMPYPFTCQTQSQPTTMRSSRSHLDGDYNDYSETPFSSEYSAGKDFSMEASPVLASCRPTFTKLGMAPHSDMLAQYQQHDYQSHSSRGINMPPHHQNYGSTNYSSQFSSDFDQRNPFAPDLVPDSYSGPFNTDLSEHHFDSDMKSGQALPDPGEYLRIKLGLQPGEPVNLWSLPDPEPGQRPPHSYPLLVRLAIHGSPNQRMTLKQIYAAIEERFEYYRNQPKGAWKGSVRHNLNLNQVFRNVHRPLTEPGKGNYWEIDHSKGKGYNRDRKRKSRRGRAAGGQDDEYDGDESGLTRNWGEAESNLKSEEMRVDENCPSSPRMLVASAPIPMGEIMARESLKIDRRSAHADRPHHSKTLIPQCIQSLSQCPSQASAHSPLHEPPGFSNKNEYV